MRFMDSLRICAALALIFLAGCGGGGSTSGGATTVAPSTTTINGVAAKGLIKSGTIRIYAIPSSGDITQKRLLLPAITSDSNTGAFSANIGTQTGVIMIEASGSYMDEASGTLKSIPDTSPLRAATVVSSTGGIVTMAVTPFTELAVRTALTNNGQQGSILSESAITTANGLVTDLFPFNILSDLPVEPSFINMNAASSAQRDYTLSLATISELANASTLNTVIEGYRTDLANIKRLSPTSVANFNTALTAFLSDSVHNQTGIYSVTSGLVNVGYYTTVLKLNTSGQLATSNAIKGVQLTVTLPTGVSVKADSAGIPLSGLVSASGVAGSGTTFDLSKYDAAANTLSLALINDLGFGSGEFATLKLTTSPNTPPPTVTNFSISNVSVVSLGGLDITPNVQISATIPQ